VERKGRIPQKQVQDKGEKEYGGGKDHNVRLFNVFLLIAIK
jgi:hypothetical protein